MHWWQIRKRDASLERELQSDLELEEEEQRERGLSPEEARYAARRAFGNILLIREQTHDVWRWGRLERLCQDLRYAMRQLRKSPGFTVVAVLTLALGIGTTTAIFTLVGDVMLRPLPFAQADRLVNIEEKVAEWSNIYPTLPVSANHFTFWQRNNRSFDAIAVMQQGAVPLGSSGRPLQVGVLWTTPGLFPALQVQPMLGRGFADDEVQKGNDKVAVLMYGLWREQFGGDPGIVGKTIRLNGALSTVIGVMPQSFHMPAIRTDLTAGTTKRIQPIGVLEPLTFSKEELAEEIGDLNYFGLGRLKSGVSVAAAAADLNSLQHTIVQICLPMRSQRFQWRSRLFRNSSLETTGSL